MATDVASEMGVTARVAGISLPNRAEAHVVKVVERVLHDVCPRSFRWHPGDAESFRLER